MVVNVEINLIWKYNNREFLNVIYIQIKNKFDFVRKP